jgi:hypothetical protein
MLITPPSSPVVASVAEDWMATVCVMVSRQSTKKVARSLTSSAQRHHASLAKTKEDNISRCIATLANEHILNQNPEQLGALFQPRVSIKTTRRRVEDNIVAPMRSLQIKQRFRPPDRHTRRLRQIHLPAERGKSIVTVTQAVQEDQDIGWGVILGRWRRRSSVWKL